MLFSPIAASLRSQTLLTSHRLRYLTVPADSEWGVSPFQVFLFS
jgi:hypothetical protein